MKTLYKILCLVGFVFCTTTCEDFLTEDPKGRLMTEAFFSSPSDLDGALNQLYNVVAANVFSSNHTCAANLWAGDDVTTHPVMNKGPLRDFDTYNVDDLSAWLRHPWSAYFVLVKCANFIINNAGRTPSVSDADKKSAIAQAHYWRAFAYFYLVRAWGPLPIMLQEEIKYDAPLNTEQEIYDLIVADLKIAEADLPVMYTKAPYLQSNINRAVCQPAAKATLGQVYLTMAGWPMNKGNEYYTLAANKLKEVIDGVTGGTYKYSLYNEFWKIHSQTHNYTNTELILGVYYSRDRGTTTACICDLPADGVALGWNDACGEIKFWKDFPEGPRKEATYLPKILKTAGVLIDWWDESRETPVPFFQKTAEMPQRNAEWDYTNHSSVPSAGEKTRHIVRLSQVYCWYAEAVGRSGQTNPLAIELLNKVRNRADGAETNLYPAGMPANELAEAAYKEHGWEAAGYYWGALATRSQDMRRMNRFKDHFEFRKQNPPIEVAPGVFRKEPVAIPSSYSWNESRMYLPYPAEDARLNAEMKASNAKRQ